MLLQIYSHIGMHTQVRGQNRSWYNSSSVPTYSNLVCTVLICGLEFPPSAQQLALVSKVNFPYKECGGYSVRRKMHMIGSVYALISSATPSPSCDRQPGETTTLDIHPLCVETCVYCTNHLVNGRSHTYHKLTQTKQKLIQRDQYSSSVPTSSDLVCIVSLVFPMSLQDHT